MDTITIISSPTKWSDKHIQKVSQWIQKAKKQQMIDFASLASRSIWSDRKFCHSKQ